MPSLRQYVRLIEDSERRTLQSGSEANAPVPLFEPAPEPEPPQPAVQDPG